MFYVLIDNNSSLQRVDAYACDSVTVENFKLRCDATVAFSLEFLSISVHIIW